MKLLTQIGLMLIATSSFAQEEQFRETHYNINNDKVVNDGYDPVSYFDGNPLQGNKELDYTYSGVIYWFSSESNRTKFIENPIKYEPQYGGWCAYALGLKPEKVKVDPKTYKIIDGKLYLFYNFYLTNTLKSWNKDEKNLKSKADKNWKIFIQ